jgi:cysteinyl-tRNA synthetase
MALYIYNTLTRQKEEFKPIRDNQVGMYVCGPTVYSDSHIGHGKSYLSFDIVVRYLRYSGYKVLYIQNLTDVGHLLDDGEDRMLKQSKIEKMHPMQIAEKFAQSYFEDMDRLGIVRPDISPRASGHITEQIEIVKKLLSADFAYEVNGSVYYDVQKFKNYGRLSGRTLEDAVEGTRVESRSEKHHPADFALWKKAESGHIMRWPSPWGEGFPGWHIECSAMSMKYLGETFDIHGGGMDNQFPHHECEIAQSESATGKPFVRYWIHNNLVTVNGQKMSKSLGNYISLKDAFKKYDPLVVRFFILQSHYRSTLDFSDDALAGAKSGYDKMINTIRNLREEIRKPETQKKSSGTLLDLSIYKKRFLEAMDDDFNTPQSIAVLFELVKEVNVVLNLEQKPSHIVLKDANELINELGGSILGVIPDKIQESSGTIGLENDLIKILIDARQKAKNEKAWWAADLIRERLEQIGIRLEDKKDGTNWTKIG